MPTQMSSSTPTDFDPLPDSSFDDRDAEPTSGLRALLGRISTLEIVVGATIAAIVLVLVLVEPNILEAPFENSNTMLFTVGGTVLAAIAFGVMLFLRVPPIVRVIVLVVPFAVVNWWLISPYFIDDVVDEQFETSIAAQLAEADPAPAAEPTTDSASVDDASATDANADAASTDDADSGAATTGDATDATDTAGVAEPEPPVEAEPVETAPPAPTGPVLLGAGQFVGLAGHDGVGDAGIFQNPDGSYTLRFENFDIENGPDLEVYLVPGADQVDLADGSIHLGALKGNIGNQSYEITGIELPPGEYTALVWCEAFSVEFVGATITI